MGRQKLNPKILAKLKKQFLDKSENAIKVKLSKLSKKHRINLNSASEIWGKAEGFSTWGLLGDEDRKSLENKNIQIIKIKDNGNRKTNQKIIFIKYPTENKFLARHIDEINKCYSANCYTASFILIRKVIENLIVEIAKKKFPNKTGEHKKIYLDLPKGRILDLSSLIKNIKNKSKQFDPEEKKLVQRILQLSEEFKDDANDKTHSLYHLSSKKELNDKSPQQIFELISQFFEQS